MKGKIKIKQNKEEIYVPDGYSLDELMDTNDSEYTVARKIKLPLSKE